VKLHRLELTGFGPFRDTQSVDFDAFDDDGVFLISGRTGAGKSSILDGVSFALYGSVPRYDGGERRLRSDHCFVTDPTLVRLEFTVADRRWRVSRAPEYERPAKRGGGTTTEPTRAELEELVGGEWIGRAAKPREVAVELDEVLGLNAQQFQQVILLAQNKFSRFLLARNDERQSLLRTLFGTKRFEQYKDELDQRRRDAQKVLDAAGEHARTLLDLAERLVREQDLAGVDDPAPDLPGRRDAARRALARADYRVQARATAREQADAAAADATAAVAYAETLARTRAELTAARAELERLEDQAPGMAAERERLARAQAAEALRGSIATAERAVAAHAEAAAAAARADADWIAAGGATGDDLTEVLDRLTGELALWTAAAAQERELAEREAELSAHDAALSRLAADLTELDARRAQIPAERERIRAALDEAARGSARLGDLRERADLLSGMADAAREADVLAAAARAAEAEYAQRSAQEGTALEAVTSLLQRRLAGFAGELGTGLVEGEPCAVCGSTRHPRPATSAGDAVTDADLAAAEAARDRAGADARAAGEQARAAQEAHARAAARAGGRDLPSLEADIAETSAAVAAAERAATEAERLSGLLEELTALETEKLSVRDGLAAQHEGVARERAATAATVKTLASEVATARGEHATVADRVASTSVRRDVARTAAEALSALGERTRAQVAALTDRDEQLATSVFADAGAATSALMPAAERSALAARIAEHESASSAARARLLTLELEVVDTVDPDLDGARAHAAAADRLRAEAIAAERDAHHVRTRLDELLRGVDDAYTRVGSLADDAALITRLADTVGGRAPNTKKMDLETFVLAAELEEIVAAANLRLSEMSSGRYTLHHSDARAARGASSGLGIEVLDAHTGRLRSAQSLSGGETFLASLALALGLAEVVTARAGGLRLDTLFVDEGFGSLDPETLDLAMRTLDELRAGGRTVGVISHVEAMKEQLPAQVVVEATAEGPSRIRQDAVAALPD